MLKNERTAGTLFFPALAGKGMNHAREGPEIPLPEHPLVHVPDILDREERFRIDPVDAIRNAGDLRPVDKREDHRHGSPGTPGFDTGYPMVSRLET